MNRSRSTPGVPISEALAAKFAEKFNLFFDYPQLDIADEIFATDYAGQLARAHAPARQRLKPA